MCVSVLPIRQIMAAFFLSFKRVRLIPYPDILLKLGGDICNAEHHLVVRDDTSHLGIDISRYVIIYKSR